MVRNGNGHGRTSGPSCGQIAHAYGLEREIGGPDLRLFEMLSQAAARGVPHARKWLEQLLDEAATGERGH